MESPDGCRGPRCGGIPPPRRHRDSRSESRVARVCESRRRRDFGTEGVVAAADLSPTEADGDWPHWGRTAGGLRYSPLTQITRENVKNLEVAWVYHTGATIRPGEAGLAHEFNFEATPIKVRDKLFLCTPHAETIAIEPETGKEVWRFDPRANVQDDEQLSCRGVSYYERPGATGVCTHRILTATLHAKLYALDADTGQRCQDFGSNGEVDLTEGMAW